LGTKRGALNSVPATMVWYTVNPAAKARFPGRYSAFADYLAPDLEKSGVWGRTWEGEYEERGDT
jgi:hypothetical protein